MNPANGTSRDDTLDASQADGVRPVHPGASPATPDATDTGPGAVVPVTGAPVPDTGRRTSSPGTAERASDATSPVDWSAHRTRASAAWAAVIAALLLSVVLIVFILQNPTTVVIHFLGWSGSVAVGMAMLIAAVTGGLLVATIGVARLTQLRVRAHRSRAVPRRARLSASTRAAAGRRR
jgi:uncharacterized integral membrane protein